MAKYRCTVCDENYFFKPDNCQECGNVAFEKIEPGEEDATEDRFVTPTVVIATVIVFALQFPRIAGSIPHYSVDPFGFAGSLFGGLLGAFIIVAGAKWVFQKVSSATGS